MLNESFICKTCGAKLEELAAESTNGLVQCPYCHNVWTIPKKETNPAALSFLRMGEHDLDTCKFDEAYEAYKKASELDKNEPEAYWGMALAKFKVQYLKDEVNNCLQPICHEVTDKKFTDDPDCMRAFMKATPEQREEYEKRAKDIDYIQNEFCKLEKTGLDYDCFICVKVTGENGNTTEDSKDADYIYRLLKDKGYKPFYSEYEIRNKQGADYEAHILYALYKSECMLVVCRDESYLQTPWVKNEYARFLKLVNDEERESDSITIVYSGKPIESLPGKKGKIQGIDFSQRSADGQITEFVERHTPIAKKKREEAAAAKLRREEENQRRYAEQQRLFEKQQREMEESQKAFEEQQRIDREETEKRRSALEEQQRKIAEQLEKMKSSSAAVSDGLSDDELFERMERVRAERERKKREEEENIARERAEAERRALEKAEAERRAREEFERRAIEAERRAIEEERIEREKAEVELQEREEAERWIKDNDPTINCFNLNEFEIDGTVLKKYKGNKSNVKFPKGITSIGSHAFEGCTYLKSIIIPDSVIFIGDYSFSNCAYLECITISNGVTNIGVQAFDGCRLLKSIAIPDSVKTIGRGAFKNCYNLKGLYITDIQAWCKIDFESYDANPLYYAHNLYLDNQLVTDLNIPQEVTQIKDYAFKVCTNLTSVTIPNSVTSIGKETFSGCENLINITIPNSVISIGERAFSGCENLTSINIPDSVTSIGNMAFSDCTSLKGVNITNIKAWCNIDFGSYDANPLHYAHNLYLDGQHVTELNMFDGIAEIKNCTFTGFGGTRITISNSVTSIGSFAFSSCTNLTSITIPNSVTSIGKETFSGCENLISITIGNGVTSIGSYAFSGCENLTSINIPDSVTSIGVDAFNCCTRLKNIIIPPSVTAIGYKAFHGCTNLIIYCNAFQKPDGWDKYWNLIKDGNILTIKRAKVVWGYKG